MAARRAWVFAGGEFSDKAFRHVVPRQDDYLISVDRGLTYCLEVGLRPDLLLGDFDSVEPELLRRPGINDVPRRNFPAEKDSSDLELALQALCEMTFDEVYVVGVSGGRTDHMLINWQLTLQRRWPFALEYIDDTVNARVLHGAGRVSVEVDPGTIVSLISLKDADGVSTLGLRYVLSDASLIAGSSLGLSNIAVDSTVTVDIESGVVLVMVTNEKQEP